MPQPLKIIILVFLLTACATTPISNRQALILIPEWQEIQFGKQAYKKALKDQKDSENAHLNRMLRRVGRRIAKVSDMPNLDWEFKLIESKDKNAFALPGGKIGVNTGLLKVANNQSQLATVIGHEIGHVQAQHSNERMSLQYATQSGMQVLGALAGEDSATKQGVLAALGVGAEYGLALPFSRKHEAEADIIGLQLMAQAGFDPRQSVSLWQNMNAANGNEPPEFMSTHPSNSTRINGLQARIPEVMPLYNQAKAAGRTPQCG